MGILFVRLLAIFIRIEGIRFRGMKRLLLVFGLGVLGLSGQTIPSSLHIGAPSPSGVSIGGYGIVGPKGTKTNYYWVVANYPIGSTNPISPIVVYQVPVTLSGGNYVTINWNVISGVSSYDVLVSSANSFPGGCGSCYVGNTSSNTINDIGSYGSYIFTPILPANLTLYLDNQNYSTTQFLANLNGVVYNLLSNNVNVICTGVASTDTGLFLKMVNSGGDVNLSSSICSLDNSSGAININNFHHKITQGIGGKIQFNSVNKLGIYCYNCDNSVWTLLTFSWNGANTVRQPGSALNFVNGNDISTFGINVINSPGAGIGGSLMVRPHIYNTTVSNNLAGGITMNNNFLGDYVGVTCYVTGDNCAELHNYTGVGSQFQSGTITNITSYNSNASCFATEGGLDLVATNISCVGSSGPAISVGTSGGLEPSYEPTHVEISGGSITNAGQTSGLSVQRTAIYVSDAGSVKVSNFEVNNPYSSCGTISSGNVTPAATDSNISISGVKCNGSNGYGFINTGITGVLEFNNLFVNGANLQCFVSDGATTLLVPYITAVNCNKTGGFNRAVDFELTTNLIVGGQINIIDNQTTATGFGYYETTGANGYMDNINPVILNGSYSSTVSSSVYYGKINSKSGVSGSTCTSWVNGICTHS